MDRRMVVVPLLLAAGLILACRSREQKALSEYLQLKFRRTHIVDDLFSRYGGSAVANGASPSGTGTVEQVVRNAVRETDRSVFEADLRRLGRGEHVSTFTDRGREFFSRPDIETSARELVKLDIALDAAERRLAELKVRAP